MLTPPKSPPPYERLRELLLYDPETGLFTRKTAKGNAPAGAVAGNVRRGYVRIGIDYRVYPAHFLAWFYVTKEWPPCTVDHINHDGSDNRFANLRPATMQQQSANRRGVRAASGFKGVTKVRGRYQAAIKVGGRSKYLGLFATPEEAHAAWAAAARRFFGAFAAVSA